MDPDQPPYYLPEERVEENGLIRSYLTGEMTDAAKANRRPIAVMMSNDKQALPQYGINRAGVVYEAPVEGDMNRYISIIEDFASARCAAAGPTTLILPGSSTRFTPTADRAPLQSPI